MMKLPGMIAKAREAENEQGTDNGGATETTSKRKTVSKRAFIDASGTLVDKIEEATGMRYTLLDAAGNHDFDYQCGEAGKLVTMAAIFGLQTKIGNVANTVLNDKDEPGTPGEAAGAIKEWLAAAEAGTWAERATGPVGAKVDKDALAASIVAVAQAAGKIDAAAVDATYAKVRQRLEEEPAYVRAARQVPDVAREYASRVGKQTKAIDDLL